jgi:hypothetical protein
VPFPPIDPHTTGRLTTTDGAEIYWEECGSPDAPPGGASSAWISADAAAVPRSSTRRARPSTP